MRDGRTRRLDGGDGSAPSSEDRIERFLEEHRAVLVVLRGAAIGSEYALSTRRLLIGRSPSAGLQLDDGSVSHEHALVELGVEGFGVRDLGSTNGVRVNGEPILATDLVHGDRLQVGDIELQLVVEAKPAHRVWELPETETETEIETELEH